MPVQSVTSHGLYVVRDAERFATLLSEYFAMPEFEWDLSSWYDSLTKKQALAYIVSRETGTDTTNWYDDDVMDLLVILASTDSNFDGSIQRALGDVGESDVHGHKVDRLGMVCADRGCWMHGNGDGLGNVTDEPEPESYAYVDVTYRTRTGRDFGRRL